MLSYGIIIGLCILFSIILKIVMTEKLKEIAKFKKRDDLDSISKKLPNNTTICHQILKKLKNEKVKVIEKQDYGANLYVVYHNEIIITDKNEEYARLQTIAHECIHSTQSKKMLWFHFILSNISIIYYFVVLLLTIVGIIKDPMLQIAVLLFLGLIHYAVRFFLEMDAMIRAEYLAKEYLTEDKNLKEEEKTKLLETYQKINKIGIPYTHYTYLLKLFIKIILYCIIAMIFVL